MRRREFITFIGGAAMWPLAASAQQSRSFRIAYLAFVTGKDSTIITERLQELGYREGKRGKSRGGMILRFPRGRESDSFWECRRLPMLTAFRTPT